MRKSAGVAEVPQKAQGNLPKTARGEATRRAILAAAERVIGSKGYNDASIGHITSEAGVAQGTFYIYFSTKEQVFSELVLEMGRLVRHEIAEATQGFENRLDAERAGLQAFLEFVQAHPDLYRIVQEALFVDPDAYQEYYETFAAGYKTGLIAAEAAGQISKGDADTRAWALMGIAKSLGEQLVVFKSDKPIPDIVEAAYSLIERGIRP
ncbi:TetR/AcrR family transcriptional regulator [Roseibium porphyridii]|uniref:TetR/AcrR family transcriptional regulator n=1 Tax=Roseibium porphyridii TaxID=2866279 RepID=A0ABY8F9M7_9HYPH|nr:MULTISPECIES: TetR/AcrR family transcriptional regulator [Stappiaceae]QFT30239.1 HTH-type transcriptional regulator EthR [Labrenzia sp. THAF82]WFE90887.1 TetR/AcrR family transcriptional regulator [Roseibium sp. KMA01]